ncbi:MAG TPA: hypothetical protein ENJ95_17385 [Bacteroidetes bacterium]|nr:hypothetical protein [Bacteroidota bacterium]
MARHPIVHYLKKKGCREKGTAVGIFNDALIEFLRTVSAGEFKGTDIKSALAFIKRAAFFIWSKHSDNPRKEDMKRGKPAKGPTEKAYAASLVMYDPMDGSENPALPNKSMEAGSVELKKNELKLSEKIKHLINKLSEECRERIRRMKFFHQEGEEKITHDETASDFGDSGAKASRKKQDKCIKRFKGLVAQTWNTDAELRSLIHLKL